MVILNVKRYPVTRRRCYTNMVSLVVSHWSKQWLILYTVNLPDSQTNSRNRSDDEWQEV